jgi:hypothetical protein
MNEEGPGPLGGGGAVWPKTKKNEGERDKKRQNGGANKIKIKKEQGKKEIHDERKGERHSNKKINK